MPGLEPGALTGVGVRIPLGAQRRVRNRLSHHVGFESPAGSSMVATCARGETVDTLGREPSGREVVEVRILSGTRENGEMADTVASKATALRREGSSPSSRTG